MEHAIRHHFLPALLGRLPSGDDERLLLSLPPSLGGLGIVNPMDCADREYTSSVMITAPLVALIIQHKHIYSTHVGDATKSAKLTARQDKRRWLSEHKDNLYSRSSLLTQRCTDLASEKGASSWLTALPLLDLDLYLHKGNFRDAVYL